MLQLLNVPLCLWARTDTVGFISESGGAVFHRH